MTILHERSLKTSGVLLPNVPTSGARPLFKRTMHPELLFCMGIGCHLEQAPQWKSSIRETTQNASSVRVLRT